MFGRGMYDNPLKNSPLLCNYLKTKGEYENYQVWQQWLERLKKSFFPLSPIRPAGRIFCSPEQSKLCFELLGINSASQNHLPLQGAGKYPPKSGFMVIMNGFGYG